VDCKKGERDLERMTKGNAGIMEGWNIGVNNKMKNDFNLTHYSTIPEVFYGAKSIRVT